MHSLSSLSEAVDARVLSKCSLTQSVHLLESLTDLTSLLHLLSGFKTSKPLMKISRMS